MYLVDTNIFLEILLMQDKRGKCKRFLNENIGNLHISDLSIHSIGIILFRYKKKDAFRKFIMDLLPTTKHLSLQIELYGEVVDAAKEFNLDFDDAYQFIMAEHYRLKIVTMDRDFEVIKELDISFL